MSRCRTFSIDPEKLNFVEFPLLPTETAPREFRWSAHGAGQDAVVQLSIQVHVQRLRRRVVDAGNVIPGVKGQRRGAVTSHEFSAGIREFEADCARPLVDRRVQLVPAVDTELRHNRCVVDRIRTGVDPGADCHAPGKAKRRRPSKVDVIRAVKHGCTTHHPCHAYRRLAELADQSVAGSIQGSAAVALVELPMGFESSGRRGSPGVDQIASH